MSVRQGTVYDISQLLHRAKSLLVLLRFKEVVEVCCEALELRLKGDDNLHFSQELYRLAEIQVKQRVRDSFTKLILNHALQLIPKRYIQLSRVKFITTQMTGRETKSSQDSMSQLYCMMIFII